MVSPASTRLRFPLLLAAAVFAGCQTAPRTPPVPFTGDPIVDGNANLAVAPLKDKALWEYRVAASSLRRGMFDEAEAKLDSALALAGSNYGNVNSEAAKSRRLFRNESDKPFIGEPYERVMASYYRAILYWRDGEPDNARALFRSGQLLDSDTEEKSYAGDYVLLDYLEGLATEKLGGDGSASLRRARQNAKQQNRAVPPDYDKRANVLVFAEYGRGPTKFAGGEFGEQLKFMVEKSKVASARLRLDERTIALPAYDDLAYQATTRGGRVMDHVLGNKAVFKQTTGAVGDVALMGALGTAQYGRGEDANKAALGLAAVGVISKIASAATTPEADARTWENLPQYLSFAALTLPSGEHPATVEYLDAAGQVLPNLTQQLVIRVPVEETFRGPTSDVIVFASALKS